VSTQCAYLWVPDTTHMWRLNAWYLLVLPSLVGYQCFLKLILLNVLFRICDYFQRKICPCTSLIIASGLIYILSFPPSCPPFLILFPSFPPSFLLPSLPPSVPSFSFFLFLLFLHDLLHCQIYVFKFPIT
jgi:hypothetical protein